MVGNLVAVPFSNNSVLLTWAKVNNAGSYVLSEVNEKVAPVTITATASEQESYTYIGLTSDESYSFILTAKPAAANIYGLDTAFTPVSVLMNSTQTPFTTTAECTDMIQSHTTFSTGFKNISTNALFGLSVAPVIQVKAQQGASFSDISADIELANNYILLRGLTPGIPHELTVMLPNCRPVIKRFYTTSVANYPTIPSTALTFGSVSVSGTSVTANYEISPSFIAQRQQASDWMFFWRARLTWYNAAGGFVGQYVRMVRPGSAFANSLTVSAPDIAPGRYRFKMRLESPDGPVERMVAPTVDKLVPVGVPSVSNITLINGSLVASVTGPVTSYEWAVASVADYTTFTTIPSAASLSLDLTGYNNGDALKVTPYNGSCAGDSHTYIVGGPNAAAPVSLLSRSQVQAAYGDLTAAEKLAVSDKLTMEQLTDSGALRAMDNAQLAKLTPETIAGITADGLKGLGTKVKELQSLTGVPPNVLKDALLAGADFSASQVLSAKGKFMDSDVLFTAQEKTDAAKKVVDIAQSITTGKATLTDEEVAAMKELAKFSAGLGGQTKALQAPLTPEQMGAAALKPGLRTVTVVPAAGKDATLPAEVKLNNMTSSYLTTVPEGKGVSIKNDAGVTLATVTQNAAGQFVVDDVVLSDMFDFKIIGGAVTAFIKAASGFATGVNAPLVTVVDISSSSVNLDVQLNQDFNTVGATLEIIAVKGGVTETYSYLIGGQYSTVQTFKVGDFIESMVVTLPATSGSIYSYSAQIKGSGSVNGPVSISTPGVQIGNSFYTQQPSMTIEGQAGIIAFTDISFGTYAYYQIDIMKSDFTRATEYVYIGGPSAVYTKLMAPGTYNVLVTPFISSDKTVSGLARLQSVVVLAHNTAVCFLGDAPVLTTRGYRPIREFSVGDTVITADGREVAVRRVFSRRYGPSAAVNPYVIPKGFLGATRPVAISPDHEVLVPGTGMVRARNLGLRRMKMAEEFTYYNLELEDWVRDNLVVAGVVVESLAPATRITMTKADFTRFVMTRYQPSAMARLRTVCFEEADGHVSMPALR